MPKSPPDLLRMQRSLRRALTDPRGARAAAKARPETLRWIAESPPWDAPSRLSVYGDGYFLRLLESLASDFPAVKRAVGADAFRSLAAGYLGANPPRSPSLADLGEAFPRFAAAHPLARTHPFLPDLARLERAVQTRLFARRLPALDRESLGRVRAEDWPRARLTFDPTVFPLETAWPVDRLWRRRELPPGAAGRGLRRAGARRLLIYRDEAWVKVAAVPRQEWAALRRLMKGARLGEALARASRSPGSPGAAEVRRWFSSWVARGLVKGVSGLRIPAAASRAPGKPAKARRRDVNTCAGRQRCA